MARSRSARAGGIQMTEGPLYKNILLFSVPLIFSQLLQVLFNMADVAVVGKFSSATALGSVGSTSTLVTLFTGFLIGLSNGVNVRVAQYLGARQEEDTRNCVHTALILCTLSGVVIAVLCFFLAAPMLELLKTKDDLLPGAVLYFRIYALGMPALGIFNFGNAVLSASGDTKRPLAYLTAAGILNVILNLFFVIVCKMAADGVALASIISQYLSAVLVLLHMTRLTDSCRVEWKLLRLHGSEVGRILGLGVPAGIQHMIFAVANLFIQVGINSFDSTVVSGNSAAVNVDNVIYNVMAAFYTACSTFRPELGRREKGPDDEELLHQPRLFVRDRGGSRRGVSSVRRTVSVHLHKRRGRRRRRHGADADHVLLLLRQRLHGLHHRCLPRPWPQLCADGDRDHGLMRVPRDLGLYDLRAFPHHSVFVSALHLLVDDHCRGGDPLFHSLLPPSAHGADSLTKTRTILVISPRDGSDLTRI